jgi:hypothetical protein
MAVVRRRAEDRWSHADLRATVRYGIAHASWPHASGIAQHDHAGANFFRRIFADRDLSVERSVFSSISSMLEADRQIEVVKGGTFTSRSFE